MKINKKIISKIEGEAVLDIRSSGGIIEGVDISFYNFRGVEDYLKNRPFMDALVINPRICGICGHSHLRATAEAIEDAFGAKISQKAKNLREITTALEIIQNHIKWFYITLYPSVLKDDSLTLKALKHSQKISKIIALIAGQYPHNSYILPGGVSCDLTNLEFLKVKEGIKHLRDIEKEIFEDMDRFFNFIDKNIGLGVDKYLVLGSNHNFKPNGSVEYVKEDGKNVTYKGEYVEVGPTARAGLKKKACLYERVYYRLKEAVDLIDYISGLDIDVSEPSYIKPEVKDSSGIGVIEAPRGPLIHKIGIKNEKIDFYDIIVPTSFNLSSPKEGLSAAQKALIGEKEEFIEPVFKCFDICAVCVTH
ncbi:MAG: cytochrome B [Epsilonproteobacteria bacterium]|nr:cytochrome B [Campylobacterota bacterium]